MFKSIKQNVSKFIEQLFCKHLNCSMVRQIHGDEINHLGGKRTIMKCNKCGKYIYK
ncbi:MAG: hypothetical protein M0P49_01060 [Bacilli bacterium]|nr:hypothetical protein [Bacilli bacterium]